MVEVINHPRILETLSQNITTIERKANRISLQSLAKKTSIRTEISLLVMGIDMKMENGEVNEKQVWQVEPKVIFTDNFFLSLSSNN